MTNLIRRVLLGGAAALVLSWSEPSAACTLCSCSTSVSALNFGNYNPTSPTAINANGTVAIDCSGVVSLFGTVDIRASAGSSGQLSQRTMIRGASSLRYNLYTDAARTTVFGDKSGGSASLSAPLTGLLIFNTSVPFYAQMLANQWVPSGTYTDTIVVTIAY